MLRAFLGIFEAFIAWREENGLGSDDKHRIGFRPHGNHRDVIVLLCCRLIVTVEKRLLVSSRVEYTWPRERDLIPSQAPNVHTQSKAKIQTKHKTEL